MDKETEKTPFTIPVNPKRATCLTCKGIGKVKQVKCPDCGGSGSTDRVNVLKDVCDVEKGIPQKKYQVIVTDLEQNKVLYKDEGFGGVMAIVERIDKFSASVVEGNFQSVMWGNPLIQRFGIDRLEEMFAKHIEEYLDALEDAGMFFTNRADMKEVLIKGNYLKLQKVMGVAIAPDTNIKPIEWGNDVDFQQANQELINKIKRITSQDLPFAVLTIEKMSNSFSNIDQQVEVVTKGLGMKKIVMAVLESAVSAFAYKEGKGDISNSEKRTRMMFLLKEIASDILEKETETKN